MGKIKGNKEIVLLLLVVIYFYVMLILAGCTNKPLGDRYFFNNDLEAALICENYQGEPFLELGKEGMEEARDKLGIKSNIVYVELKDSNEKINQTMNRTAIDNNVVIVLGEWLKSAVQVSSKELKARNFVIVDNIIEEQNVKSILYKNQEGGFLMGIVAAGESKNQEIGFIGGTDDEAGAQFLSGYAAGAKTINPKCYEKLINYENVRFTEDFKNESKAYIKAKELYNNGCDIIFHACGSSGKGVYKAAKEMGKKAIGVDADCAKVYPEYKEVIISSMIKRIDKAVFEVCKSIKEGNFKSGKANIQKWGIKEGMIDFSEGTEKNVSKNTYTSLITFKEKIKNGEIEVPGKIFEVIEFKAN